jgi:phosphatidyl-myo-inositol dimannoside synthase
MIFMNGQFIQMRAAVEAMASGRPVVASSLDGSREAVLDGELGELADPHDRESAEGGHPPGSASPTADT